MNSPRPERMRNYEQSSEQVLPRNTHIIARVDGHNFSTLTDDHEFSKPFDPSFEQMMNRTAMEVFEYCTGSEVAYVQSDEISLYIPASDEPFLANRTQKMASLLASYAGSKFTSVLGEPVQFDGRVFMVPKSEVLDYFIWRQEDAWNNCVHSVAFFELADETSRGHAHERLQGMSLDEKQEFLFQEFNINVNDIPTHRKRGACIKREDKKIPIEEHVSEEKYENLLEKGYIEPDEVVERSEVVVDTEIPQFHKNPRYIDHHVYPPVPQVA